MGNAVSICVVAGIFFSSAVFGVWLFRRFSTWEVIDRFIVAALPVISVIILGMICKSLVGFDDWDDPRLAPAFALAYGYKLYYGSEGGPMLNTIYGPMSALIFLPATLARSPTGALVMGKLIAYCLSLIPMLWLFLTERVRSMRNALIGLLAFACFFFFTRYYHMLTYSVTSVSADAPVLGLSALACAFLFDQRKSEKILSLCASAVFVWLAIFTKIHAVSLLCALPLYVLFADGRRCFIKYLLCLFVSGALLSTFFLMFFGPKLLILNTIIIPIRHPWTEDLTIDSASITGLNVIKRALSLSMAFSELLHEVFFPFITLSFYTLYQYLFLTDTDRSSPWFNRNRWVMFALVGLATIPTSLLSRVKWGGSQNSYSIPVYFMLAAVILVLAQASTASPARAKHVRDAAKLFLILCVVTCACFQVPGLFYLHETMENLSKNPSQEAYEYAKRHPGEAYFPWNPISSLLAEGKLYHTTFGLWDRDLAGLKISDEHVRAYIPRNIKIMAFRLSKTEDRRIGRFLPEFKRKVTVEGLPGWTVYASE